MTLKWCCLDGVREATSSISSRRLRVNEGKKFYVAPDGDFRNVGRIVSSFLDDHCASFKASSKPGLAFLDCLKSLQAAGTAGQFAQSFDHLIGTFVDCRARAVRSAKPAEGGRLLDLCIRFHAEGLLALPYNIPYTTRAKYPRYEWSWGRNYPLLKRTLDFVGGQDRRNHMHKFRGIIRLFLCTQGAAEHVDLTPEVDDGLLFKENDGSSDVPAIAKTLIQLMRQEHPETAIGFDASAYGTNRPTSRSDGTFSWVEESDPSLTTFAAMAKSWVQSSSAAFSTNVSALNRFFDFLLAMPDLDRSPRSFLLRPTEVGDGGRFEKEDVHAWFRTWLIKERELSTSKKTLPEYINRTSMFLDWVLSEHCSIEGVVAPQFWNPLRREEYQVAARNETTRSALPSQFVRMLKDIIRAPYTVVGAVPDDVRAELLKLKYVSAASDGFTGSVLPDTLKKKIEDAGAHVTYGFEWPQQQARESFRFLDPEHGTWVDTWSPVRTYFTLVKLELPLRSFQVVALESSEADDEMYDLARGWVPNPTRVGPARAARSGESRFVLRQMTDQSSLQEYVGLFINTNKTRDQSKGVAERGYEIPWEHREAIRLFTELDAWQRRYNPVTEAVPWTKVPQLEDRYTAAQLASRPHACFLFRDPLPEDPRHPLSSTKLDGYWENLLTELEKRVWASGMRHRNGSRIVFVDGYPNKSKRGGMYRVPRYDLHSLRVTMITALAEVGVPISLLSKFVAGHATIVMTLYYAKFGPAHVTALLNEASLRIEKNEQAQYERFLADASYQDIVASAAINDPIAAEMAKKHNPGAWVTGDLGICPVGCSRCHEGGESLRRKAGGSEVYGPVPGGNQNCVRCRFFITGPAFLVGLHAHFNDVGYRLMEKSRRYREIEHKLEALEEERYISEIEARPFLQSQQLSVVSEAFSLEGKELDETVRNWHATQRLIGRCFAVMQPAREEMENANAGDPGVSLVLAGTRADLRAAFRTTSDFDLADAVCQSATFYERVDATMPSLRRADIINSMLAANHRKPVFLQLTDEQKLTVGNDMVKLLIARSSYDDTLALMEGKKTLEALGMSTVQDLDRMLGEVSGEPLRVSFGAADKPRLAIEGVH